MIVFGEQRVQAEAVHFWQNCPHLMHTPASNRCPSKQNKQTVGLDGEQILHPFIPHRLIKLLLKK